MKNVRLDAKRFDLKSFLMDYAIYLILTALVIVIAVISPKFLSIKVAKDILMQSAVRIVVAMGCMFIIFPLVWPYWISTLPPSLREVPRRGGGSAAPGKVHSPSQLR